MFILGNFLLAFANVIDFVLMIYKWIIIIAAVVSWVNPDPYNPIVRLLYRATEPALRPIRRVIGAKLGPIDISPLIVVLIIIFIQQFIIKSIIELGYKIKGGSMI